MKKLVLAIGACALLLSPISGCGSFLKNPSVQGAASTSLPTSVQQASTVKAAGSLYVLAAHAATAYLDSGQASKETARTMGNIEIQMFNALMDARQADKEGRSPAVAVALSAFNANYADLANIIPGLK